MKKSIKELRMEIAKSFVNEVYMVNSDGFSTNRLESLGKDLMRKKSKSGGYSKQKDKVFGYTAKFKDGKLQFTKEKGKIQSTKLQQLEEYLNSDQKARMSFLQFNQKRAVINAYGFDVFDMMKELGVSSNNYNISTDEFLDPISGRTMSISEYYFGEKNG